MRLRHIEIFHAVFVTGSVSGAARALNVSQPTVSKILKHAEDGLGFALFHRIKGKLIPTEKGKSLFVQAEPVFEQVNDLKKFASILASKKEGKLRIAITPAFSLELAPNALSKFSKQYENITIEVETLHSAQMIKALLDESIDIGLLFDAPKVPGISSEVIGQSEFICVAPENYIFSAQGASIDLDELESHPLITLNEKSVLGRVLANKLSQAFGQAPDSRFIVETYHIAKRLAQQGAGVALIDEITAFSGSQENLCFKRLNESISIDVCIVTRLKQAKLTYHSDFIDILSKSLLSFNTRIKR